MISLVSKHYYVLALLAMQIHLIQSFLFSINRTNEYLHHICLNGEGTFKSKTYDKEVKELIDFMSRSYLKFGFGNALGNDGSDQITAKFQCRGDASKSVCKACMSIAFSEIRKKCPNNKGRIIWYDNCFLILSSNYTFQKIDYREIFYMNNAKDVSTDKMLFNKNTKALLYKLKEKAIIKDKMNYLRDYMYASGHENIDATKVYGMVQCAQDLSPKNCTICFEWIIKEFPECCDGKQGGRVLSPSCNFRYELYPFVKL
ncbi:unnamed protein product [Cochlearia groenlandica]